MTEFDHQNLRDWLLRRLDADCAARLDHALFTDVDLADRLDEARCDLYDDYAHQRLSAWERDQVRQHLAATPVQAQRLRIACALAHSERARSLRRPPERVRSSTRQRAAWRIVSVAACVLLAATIGVWRMAAWRSAQRPPQISTQPVPILSLAAARQRGAPAHWRWTDTASTVRVQAEIEMSHTSSTVFTLRILDREQVQFQANDLKLHVSGPYRYVEADVPADLLRPGSHRISVHEENNSAAAQIWDVESDALH